MLTKSSASVLINIMECFITNVAGDTDEFSLESKEG